MQPNMRAVEKYEDMGRRLKEVCGWVMWMDGWMDRRVWGGVGVDMDACIGEWVRLCVY